MLVDNAIVELLRLPVWRSNDFIDDLYRDSGYKNCVEQIFSLKKNFFTTFARNRFKRQLRISDIIEKHQMHKIDEDADEKERLEYDNEPTTLNYTTYDLYRVYAPYTLSAVNADDEEKNVRELDHARSIFQIVKQMTALEKGNEEVKFWQYRLFSKVSEEKRNPLIADIKNLTSHWVKEMRVGNDATKQPVWAMFHTYPTPNGRRMNPFQHYCSKYNIKCYGEWLILNEMAENKYPSSAVPIKHLNAIFHLLRYYYSLRNTQDKKALKDRKHDHTPLKIFYVDQQDAAKTLKVEILIIIDDKEYTLTFWNSGKRKECNAFSIISRTPPKTKKKKKIKPPKERHYLRFVMDDTTEFQWYDNDQAFYQIFPDFDKNHRKDGLLKKQLEAIFQSNLNEVFPWKLYKMFNNSHISFLTEVLEMKGVTTSAKGYICRFSQSKQLKAVTNIEQVAISIQSEFPRKMRALQSGRNRMFQQGMMESHQFIENWKGLHSILFE